MGQPDQLKISPTSTQFDPEAPPALLQAPLSTPVGNSPCAVGDGSFASAMATLPHAPPAPPLAVRHIPDGPPGDWGNQRTVLQNTSPPQHTRHGPGPPLGSLCPPPRSHT